MSDVILPDDNSISSIRKAFVSNFQQHKNSTRTFQIDNNKHTARIFGDIAIVTGALTGNATVFVNGKDQLRTMIFKPVALSGGPYIVTFTSGLANTATVKMPVMQAGNILLSGISQFDLYVDAQGNISSSNQPFSGTNSNGSYIQFADGTLKEWGTVSVVVDAALGQWYTEGVQVNFPSSYLSIATIIGSTKNGSGNQNRTVCLGENYNGRTSSGCIFYVGSASNGDTVILNWELTGRWK